MWSRIWKSWRYISNRELKIEKRLQKIMKKIIRGSKVSMKKNSKNLNRLENFVKRFKIIRLRVSAVRERSI